MIPWIKPGSPDDAFPPIEQALRDPNGLLCAGGDLSSGRLIHAYQNGIFPWYSDGEPILWWTPDPRMLFVPRTMKVSRRLRRTIRKVHPLICFDENFSTVVQRCAEPRPGQPSTWITPDMAMAYQRLHELGVAHSATAYVDGKMAGGIYGLAIGRCFFGESMFSACTDGSKFALIGLLAAMKSRGYVLLDAQVRSDHLKSLGAVSVPRHRFRNLLQRHADVSVVPEPFTDFVLDDWHE